MTGIADPASRRMRTWRWRVFGGTWLAYAGYYLCRKNLAVVMPALRNEAGFSEMDLANVIAIYSLVYAVGHLHNGGLADRFGARRVVGLGMLLCAAANLAMGFVAASFLTLGALAIVNGFGQSTGWSGTVKNMSAWFRREERGTVMGLWGTCYVLGSFLASVVATWAAYDAPFLAGLGWKRAFFFPAALLVVVTLGFLLTSRNHPRDVGLPAPEGSGHPAESGATPGTGDGLRVLARDPTVWLVGLSYFLVKLTRYAFLFWLPLYLADQAGSSVRDAGYTSSLFELVGFAGAIGAGVASDRLFASRRMPVGALMLWGLALVCLAMPTLTAAGPLGTMIAISLAGVFTFGPDTLLSGATAMDLGGRYAGTAAGLVNGIGSFGQFVSPYVVAVVVKQWGWDNLFSLFVVLALLGGGLLSLRWSWGRRPAVLVPAAGTVDA
jgi:OPA family glycerol-3-phosphate transporter-like MFS transporter